MNAHDDAFLDAVAVYALGALGPTDLAPVREHLRTCEICRREYRELYTTASMIGYAAESPLEGPAAARLRSRVATAVLGHASAPSNGVAARAPRAARGRGRLPYWLAVGTAAASIAAAVVFSQQNATLRARDGDATRQIAYLTAPEAQRFDVPGGAIVRSGKHVLVVMRDVPPAPAGKTYEAWTLAAGAKTMAPSSLFEADPSGLTVVELPIDASTVTAIAVSLEPENGSTSPTSTPAFVRKLI